MKNVEIRNFRDSDTKSLFRFRSQIGTETDFVSFKNDSLENLRVNQSYFSEPTGGHFLALIDGRVIGLVYFSTNYQTKASTIETIGVLKEARGMGVGKKLLEKVFYYLVQKGFNKVSLEVDKENTTAISFYKSLGFTKLSETKTDIKLSLSLSETKASSFSFRKESRGYHNW